MIASIKKFPPGTVVRVYATINGTVAETKGEVTRIRETDGMLYVNLRGRRGEIVAHPMQCRRLVKKPRRRVWVAQVSLDGLEQAGPNRLGWATVSIQEPQSWHAVEFIEVKKRGGA